MVAPPTDAQEAARELRVAWAAQTGGPPADLAKDLASLGRWFDPKARGERLRRELASLPRSTPTLKEPFILSAGEGRHLVTPEGRCLLELLASTPSEGGRNITLSSLRASELEGVLLGVYRDWAQQRLRDVIALQAGNAPPLLPQAIGQVLLLLVNGSIAREHAMRVPERTNDARVLDEAQSSVVEAFAEALSPSPSMGRRRSRHMYALRSGYSLTEARRRLGAALVIDPKTHDIFIEGGAEDAVRDRVAEEIIRRNGRELERLPDALDALIAAYERARPTLAAYGQAHSNPSRPFAVRQSLLDAVYRRER
jgi:hypothetical protein